MNAPPTCLLSPDKHPHLGGFIGSVVLVHDGRYKGAIHTAVHALLVNGDWPAVACRHAQKRIGRPGGCAGGASTQRCAVCQLAADPRGAVLPKRRTPRRGGRTIRVPADACSDAQPPPSQGSPAPGQALLTRRVHRRLPVAPHMVSVAQAAARPQVVQHVVVYRLIGTIVPAW